MWVPRPARVLNVIHHPGRVWLKTYFTDKKGIHVRIVDCEHGEWDGSKTILSFYPNDGWQGHLWNDPNRYTLTKRQAQAMFDGMFDWLIDWWRQ